MKYPYTYIDQAVRMLKALVASYIVTGLLLLLTAGLLYRFELSEGKVRIMIIVTYILSCFAGGFLSGKMMKNKKFLWGILVGLLYFGIMLLVSLDQTAANFVTTMVLCILGGMLGGMCA